MDRFSMYKEFERLAPVHEVKKLSEQHHAAGSSVDILVDALRVWCSWRPGDLAVSVTTNLKADGYSPDWAGAWSLYLFIERKNDPADVDAIVNSTQQMTWLIANFDSVYSLMCDGERANERQAFFDFEERELKAISERNIEAMKKQGLPDRRK